MPKRLVHLAKLARPRLHTPVRRERLFALLDAAAGRPMAWVHGPPGAGKTTLVASWLESRRLPFCWYQVDGGDADPAAFFYFLVQLAQQGRRRGRLPYLTREHLHDIPGFARRFFARLFLTLPPATMLVLDNCQEASDTAFERLLAAAAESVPSGCCLVIVSRAAAGPSLARLGANDMLCSIGWQDLRLREDETRALIVGRAGDLAAAPVLHRETDGWAAGLVLLLAQPGLPAVHPGIGSRESLFEYFAGEIFDRASDDVQRVLLRTCLFSDLTPAMAVEASDVGHAPSILDQLYRRGYFVDRRVEKEPVYRYHDLFREFLLARLHTSAAQEDINRHRLCLARILEREGRTAESIGLLLDAEQWPDASRLIRTHARAALASGQSRTLALRIERIPARQVQADAWLLFWLGRAREQWDPVGCRETLACAFDGFRAADEILGQLMAAASLIHAHFLEYSDFSGMDSWIEAIGDLLGRKTGFTDPEDELHVLSALLIGIAMRKPAHTLRQPCAQRVGELLATSLDDAQRLEAAVALVTYYGLAAEYERGAPVVARIFPLTQRDELSALNRAYLALYGGWFFENMYDRVQGAAAYDEVQRLAQEEALPGLRVLADCFRVYQLTAWGDIERAAKTLREAQQSLDPSRRPMDMAQYHNACCSLSLAKGDGAEAARNAEVALASLERLGALPLLIVWRGKGALALILDQRFTDAEVWLSTALSESELGYLACYRPWLLFVRALSRFRSGRSAEGAEDLAQALALAREVGGASFFRLMMGNRSELYAEALRKGVEVPYVQDLIMRTAAPAPSRELESWPWPIRIYALGAFRLYADGHLVVFNHKTPRKPLALLKAIVAAGGEDVPAQRIMDALWPDEEGDAAEEALRVNVYRLRKLLGSTELVQWQDQRLSLDRNLCWADVWALKSITDDLPSGDPSTIVAKVHLVLGLYRGDFLPEDSDEPWLLGPRERLRNRSIRFLTHAGVLLEAAHRYEEAVRCYERGIDIDAVAEGLYQGAMRCHRALGRRAEGLALYRRLEQTLHITVGILPSASSRTLYRALASD